jgi:hypothetical protein
MSHCDGLEWDLNEKEQAVFVAVNVALFSLKMKRLVKQLPGKLFVRIR